ncbi:MAG: hypothetical protein KBS95_07870 [Alistipes sp.]|nr:hypothetical protein [Candidatus Alistipes equi]
MKKIYLFAGLALMLMAFACSKDNTMDVNPTGKLIVNVGLEDCARTQLGTGEQALSILWSKGDVVSFIDAIGNVEDVMVADEYVGKSTADFAILKLSESNLPFKVVYPASAVLDGQIHLPSNQDYVANSFANNSAVIYGVCSNISTPVTLKALSAFVKVSIDTPVDAIIFESNSNEPVAGTFEVVDNQMNTIAGSGALYLGNLPQGGAKEFILSVPSGNYSQGFTVKVKSAGKLKVKTAYASGKTLNAGVIVNMPEIALASMTESTETIISNGDEFVTWLATGDMSASARVTLAGEIDLAGKTVTSADLFQGVLDGNGYRIKNCKMNRGLIKSLSGTIKNLIIDESCSLEIPEITATTNIGFLVDEGTASCVLSGIVNYASSSLTTEQSFGFQYKAGNIIGYAPNGSFLENCINYGDMTITSNGASASSYYFGGVIGNNAGATDVVTMTKCVNYGNVLVNVEGGQSNLKNFYVGGVSGASNSSGIVDQCENHGKVLFHSVKASTGAYLNVGGVTGYTAARVDYCKNYGEVSIEIDSEGSVTRPNVGGVAGYVSKDLVGNINYGKVTLQGGEGVSFGNVSAKNADSGGVGGVLYPCVAGVVGSAGYPKSSDDTKTYKSAKAVSLTECANYGEVVLFNPGGEKYVGVAGVVGYSYGNLTDCSNYGHIYIKTGGVQTYCGGIIGVAQGKSTYTGLISSGKLTFELSTAPQMGKATTRSYLGGIYGSYSSGSSYTMTNCICNAELVSTTASTMNVGGLAGAFNGTFDNCSFNGKIIVSNATGLEGYISEIGGLVGYLNGDVANSTNLGTIDVTCNSETINYIGGLVGAEGGADKTLTGKVGGTISAPYGKIGIALGSTRAAVVTTNLGNENYPLIVSKLRINDTPVSETDIQDKTKMMGNFIDGADVNLAYVILE